MKRYEGAKEQIRVMEVMLKGFYIPPGLGKPPPESVGSGSWGWGHLGSLGLQAAATVPPLAKGQKWMDYGGKMSVCLMYWLFALQLVFMLSMIISEVIPNNYVHGLCFHVKSYIRSGFALTSKAVQPDVSWLGMYFFKDAICGRRRGVFVHITANLLWLLGSPADIWVVFTPYSLDEVGILKSAHNSQDDYVFIVLLCVSVWLCLYVQFQQSSLCW